MNSSQLIANCFEIKDLLGRGGMGDVYRATDTQTGETVTIKALHPEILKDDPTLLERFVREGEALRQLNHPNIVKMVTAFEENGRYYLVMEFVGGGSLQDLLSTNGQLPHERVIQIALDLADALTRAHRLGIIHRDLKPANVLLAEDGTPRLADFGIAHLAGVSQLTQTGVVMGSLDYVSPEACRGEVPNERADIWSFGVMLFQMLSGEKPFKGDSMVSKLNAILNQKIPDLNQLAPDAPDALIDLVYRMMEKDSQQRVPSVRLVGAELEAILKGRDPVTPSHHASKERRFETPTPSPQKSKHNLPAQTTAFVGRQAELTELARLLNAPTIRLVTILGTGGMGKTRLSLEAGAAQLEHYPNGVYFVPLAPLAVSDGIVPTTAQALGFSFYEGSEPRQQLLDYLREKSMLLIMDNFEHLLDGTNLVTEILQAAPKIKILCTTRARLDIPGEQIFHLEGMEFPDWETPADALEYSAVKLFLQSARRVRPGFELAADDLTYVARICRVVGGMPLGILLAAAWVEMLIPREIADEIQRSLDFLETGQQSVPERQHSMRGVFDYAWSALTEGEQQAFRAISVFRGGFTREAAQAVTQASLRELMGLVNKSLLHRTPSGRFEIHELLRQYGAEKLAEVPALEQSSRERHCAYFADFLHKRESGLHGKDQQTILSEIEMEIENIRIGWDWAVEHVQVERLADYLESMGELYNTRGWSREGANLFSQAIQKLSDVKENNCTTQLLRGKLLMWQGILSSGFDVEENVDHLLQSSAAIFREVGALKEAGYVLRCYGTLHTYRNSASSCQESLEIFQRFNDRRGIALSGKGLAWAALHQGYYPLAKQRFQNSLNIFREICDQKEIARSLDGLGYVCWILGEYKIAKQHHEEMLALSKEIGDQVGVAGALGNLGIAAMSSGDHQQAREFWQASLALYREIGDMGETANQLGDLAELALEEGDYAHAIQLAQESIAYYANVISEPRSWNHRIIGEAALRLGNLEMAQSYLQQSLQQALKIRRWGFVLLTLVGVAELFVKQNKEEYAYELLTLVMNHRASWQMTKDQSAPLIAELETELPPDVAKTVQERGCSRDLENTVQELLVELGGNS